MVLKSTMFFVFLMTELILMVSRYSSRLNSISIFLEIFFNEWFHSFSLKTLTQTFGIPENFQFLFFSQKKEVHRTKKAAFLDSCCKEYTEYTWLPFMREI